MPAVRRVAGIPSGAVEVTLIDSQEVGREHLRDTIAELIEASELISDAIASGTLAIVGANYRLLEGRAVPDIAVGAISPGGVARFDPPAAAHPETRPSSRPDPHPDSKDYTTP